MQLDITGNGQEVTTALKTYTEEKLSKIQHHNPHLLNIKVTFSVEKLIHTAKIIAHTPGSEFVASCTSENLYKALDGVVLKIDRLIQDGKG